MLPLNAVGKISFILKYSYILSLKGIICSYTMSEKSVENSKSAQHVFVMASIQTSIL